VFPFQFSDSDLNFQDLDLLLVFSNKTFIDETLIRIQKLPLYHIRERGKAEAYTKMMKKDKINLNIWGGKSNFGVTQFVGFENNMNGQMYCEILLKYVLPFAADFNDGNIIVHQDYASTHWPTR
jgi:hypothetical protein